MCVTGRKRNRLKQSVGCFCRPASAEWREAPWPRALEILPCEGPDLCVEVRGRDARAGQVERVEEYLHNKAFLSIISKVIGRCRIFFLQRHLSWPILEIVHNSAPASNFASYGAQKQPHSVLRPISGTHQWPIYKGESIALTLTEHTDKRTASCNKTDVKNCFHHSVWCTWFRLNWAPNHIKNVTCYRVLQIVNGTTIILPWCKVHEPLGKSFLFHPRYVNHEAAWI
jgi:hypothetical protein